MSRSARHSRSLEATKEIWVPITGGSGSAYTQIGGHTGYLLVGDSDYAYAEVYIPWDFGGIDGLKEAAVSFIAQDTISPMTFRVVTDWCKKEHAYFDKNQQINCSVNTVLNRLQEVSIARALKALTTNAPLEAGDYLGVQISRQTGQNTNAIFLGVRIRYNTPIYEHAP